jgi:hypothetical protein
MAKAKIIQFPGFTPSPEVTFVDTQKNKQFVFWKTSYLMGRHYENFFLYAAICLSYLCFITQVVKTYELTWR